ncbi:MAG: TetR/AcrR family transcriptional regulator [Deinococcota bacterium]
MTQAKASARERLLSTASQLFYQRGFQAVGVDTVVAESGVAKMTLYRHFPSKDDLIVAYLERANDAFWKWLESAITDLNDPKEKLEAIFDALRQRATSPQCLGCPFQSTAAEFPDPEHPAHRVALAHKQAILVRFTALANEAHLQEPEVLAEQLLMLMDGAWVAARMFGLENPAIHVARAARTLITASQ